MLHVDFKKCHIFPQGGTKILSGILTAKWPCRAEVVNARIEGWSAPFKTN